METLSQSTFQSRKTFFALGSSHLQYIRHNTMALVHYGFSREEALWMPVTEMNDYVLLINEQIEKENGEIDSGQREQNETPTINDVFRGTGMPHL